MMNNTNNLFDENELGPRLRLLNIIIFSTYGVCLLLFMLLYARHEAGQIRFWITFIPAFVLYGVIFALTRLISRFDPKYFPDHLDNNVEFAKNYYSGRLLLDNAFLVKNLAVLALIMMVLMFAVRLIVRSISPFIS